MGETSWSRFKAQTFSAQGTALARFSGKREAKTPLSEISAGIKLAMKSHDLGPEIVDLAAELVGWPWERPVEKREETLALLPFSLPLLVPPPYYALTFALMMVLVAGLISWLLVRFHSQRSATLFLFLLALGAGALFQTRYDLLPATSMLICLLAAERQRWNLAYMSLAVGVLLKLYPIVALPALFVAEQQSYKIFEEKPALYLPWQWHWRHIALFGSIVLGVTGCFVLLYWQAPIISPVSYFLQRPPQIESLQSSVLWLAHTAGMPVQIVLSYGSLNILSPLANKISWMGACLCILGCLFVFWLQWRQRLSPGQVMIALLCIVIITGKVFSPQYLIWLIPVVAYVGASRLWLICWVAISLLTMGIYVGYYSQLTNPENAAQTIQTLPGFFVVVGIRNGIFLFATLAYLFDWFQARKKQIAELSNGLTLDSGSGTLAKRR